MLPPHHEGFLKFQQTFQLRFMPNLALSGEVNNPDLVVAPIRVNGLRSICTVLAFGPVSITRSIL